MGEDRKNGSNVHGSYTTVSEMMRAYRCVCIVTSLLYLHFIYIAKHMQNALKDKTKPKRYF